MIPTEVEPLLAYRASLIKEMRKGARAEKHAEALVSELMLANTAIAEAMQAKYNQQLSRIK